MLRRLLDPHHEKAYVLLRFASGLMFSFHGMQKIFGVLSERTVEVGSQLWIGGLIELIGGLAIAFGVFTVWAAFICSGTMAVAYIQYHWKLKFDSRLLPGVNGGEPALIYSILFLYIACRGPGRLSWDKR